MKKQSSMLCAGLLGFILAASGNQLSGQSEYKSVHEVSGLEVGAEVPDFVAVNQNDEEISLYDLIKNGPVVLVFYRGVWCPICNNHLSELQENLKKVEESGATIVAVSPERPEFLRKTAGNTGAAFTLLYDKDYQISKIFDLTFLPDEQTIAMLEDMLNVDLAGQHSDDSQRLPVPATYIIGKNSKVLWRHFDPDYRNRSGIEEIIQNLPR